MNDKWYAVCYGVLFVFFLTFAIISWTTPCGRFCEDSTKTTTTITAIQYADGTWNNSTTVRTVNENQSFTHAAGKYVLVGATVFFGFGFVVMTESAIQDYMESRKKNVNA